MAAVILKPGRERSLRRRHPWIFSGAIARIEGQPGAGATVDVAAADGTFLGRGAYSGHSQIRVRMWTFDAGEEVSAQLLGDRLERAIEARRALFGGSGSGPTACRLVNAESDRLPGLIVDRYGDHLVCQFLAAGAEHWKDDIVAALERLLQPAGIYERSDTDVRAKEGLPPRTGVLAGAAPPDQIEIREGACSLVVDVKQGQKTGMYLDQRDNRALVAEYAAGAEVLNGFAYTGAFGVAALAAGAARVTSIESSPACLELARRNLEINGLDSGAVENVGGDVFAVLRRYRGEGRRFDLVILDPPKFATSRAQLEGACRGYKDINLLAFQLLRPGGILFTFSCSGLLERDLFQKIVADAALDAGRDGQILRWLTQAADHPVALSFPEGAYLKGLVCRSG